MTDRFEHHARIVSLLTLVSRVTGVARDAALSRIFGAGVVADAFFFAFMIPNLFRRLFGEGALAAAFLPLFARLDRDDPAQARALASLTIGGLVAGLGAIVLVLETALFALSARSGHANLAIWLTMIMLPYMPLVCTVAILGAMLQVRGRFGPTAAAPIVLNGCLIAAAVGGAMILGAAQGEERRLAHIGAVAASVVVAGVLQVTWSLLVLRPRTWWAWNRHAAARPARRMIGQAVPMILGLGVLQVNTLFDGLIASYPTAVGATIFGHPYPLAPGAMTAVSFAQRLYQFPLGVFGIAVATAIFPALSRQASDPDGFAATVRRGMRLVVFVGLPASAGLIVVRELLATVVLRGGDFDAADTARVSVVLLGYASAVWAYSMVHVLTRAFYARHDAMTPVKIAAGVVVLNLALNCTLIWTPLREAGLAWSTAICAVLQTMLLTWRLGRGGGHGGDLLDAMVRSSWARSAVATVVMTACVLGAHSFAPSVAAASWGVAFGWLMSLVVIGVIVYGTMTLGLRMAEVRWLIERGPS